jgi:hypothetical protein
MLFSIYFVFVLFIHTATADTFPQDVKIQVFRKDNQEQLGWLFTQMPGGKLFSYAKDKNSATAYTLSLLDNIPGQLQVGNGALPSL